MRERAVRARLLGVIARVRDHALKARDSVLEHRRQIVGEYSSGTRLQSQVRSVHQQHARAAVGGVGALKVAHDALDFALLGQGYGHVEVEPNHMAVEVWSSQQCAQLTEVAAPPVDPPPERNRLLLYARTQPVPEERDESNV